MAPRKKEKQVSESEYASESEVSELSESESDSDEAPVAKKAKKVPAKKAAAATPPKKAAVKRKAPDDAATTPISPSKRRTVAELDDLDIGCWHTVDESLMWAQLGDVRPSAKIAAYDLDGTLVLTKSGSEFANSAADWKWFNAKVSDSVRAAHKAGYKVVIFTNQGGIKKALTGKKAVATKKRIQDIVAMLGVPAQAFIAPKDDKYRKPATGMWDYMATHCNGGVAPDLAASFYIGDAAGRPRAGEQPADHSNADAAFAAAIGLPFSTPEDKWGPRQGKMPVEKLKGAPRLNNDITDVFRALEKMAREAGDTWRGNAYRKAAASIDESFGERITLGNLKEVGKLPGVGKGSLAHIKEFLETGGCEALGQVGGGVAEPPASAATAKAAMKAEANKALAFL